MDVTHHCPSGVVKWWRRLRLNNRYQEAQDKSLLEKWARRAPRNKSGEIMEDRDNGPTKQTGNTFLSFSCSTKVGNCRQVM